MHNLSSAFILGYHGCDRRTGEQLLQNQPFRPSENDYDWLGSGVYFWEANPDRALQWARERSARKQRLEGLDLEPFVVGAVIDPGFCLDLISSNGTRALEGAYDLYKQLISSFQGSARRLRAPLPGMPVNRGGDDHMVRKLDCAIVNFLHSSRQRRMEPAFSGVRSAGS